MNRKAVVLLSGGLDSATTLAIARSQGFDCNALSFNYGQRHDIELTAARRVADSQGVVVHKIINVDLGQIGGSALTDMSIPVPESPVAGIPLTYVPARNTIFLSFALAYAETLNSFDIFIGVNAVDYSGYPDCRPEYIQAFIHLANLATGTSNQEQGFNIHTPLIHLSKSEIIALGIDLGIDYSATISCYQPDLQGRACGVCDSCRIRRSGFEKAGMPDPTRYQNQL
jgi:7-cyano-7-deazaguanine synthase